MTGEMARPLWMSGAAGHDAEQGDFAAVKHVRQDVDESFRAAGHFERDVEAFFHSELLHPVGQFFGAHVECECDAHFTREIEAVGIDVGNDDVTGAGSNPALPGSCCR